MWNAVVQKNGLSAQKKAQKYGIHATTFDEICADPDIELVVNLTPVPEHTEIIRKALNADKHVYTEKVLAENLKEAVMLQKLAKEKIFGWD